MGFVREARQQQILGGALVVRLNKVLLLKRAAADCIFLNQWEIPAGKKELGEVLEKAVRRECKEEAGLDVVVGRLFNYIEYGRDSHGVVRDCTQLNFLCSLSDPEQAVILSPEHEDFLWVEKGAYDFLTNPNTIKTLDLVFAYLGQENG